MDLHSAHERKLSTFGRIQNVAWSKNWPVTITAGFALIWIVHRAMVQSITLDEANTFRYWVAPDLPTHWAPHANNHVLNSLLMRLSIWVFGLSHLSVRAPALLGGVLYVSATYGFCKLLSQDLVLTWALFICFVYNPFVMDYLVAARGYGLALGFLSLAMYLFARAVMTLQKPGDQEILYYAKTISACVAVSFCANFSFAYANAFLLGAFLVWAIQEQRRRGEMAYWRLALACVVPLFLILFGLAGSTLVRFSRDQLVWGARSLSQTWGDIREASFPDLNAYLVNPLLADFLGVIQRNGVMAALTGVTTYLILLLFSGRLRYLREKSRLRLAGSLAAVLVLTLLAHWLQFKFLKILLPFERTSLFFVPLATAVVGVILSMQPSTLAERAVRGFAVAVLCATGIYFIGTLRDSYFREWKICADLKAAFPVAVDQCRRAGIRQAACDLNYTATLNFYRILYKADVDEFPDTEAMPSGKSVYVLPEHQYADFIRHEGLEVRYRGVMSDLVVVVRPGAAAKGPCRDEAESGN